MHQTAQICTYIFKNFWEVMPQTAKPPPQTLPLGMHPASHFFTRLLRLWSVVCILLGVTKQQSSTQQVTDHEKN